MSDTLKQDADRRYFSVARAARYLDVSDDTIRRALRDGRLTRRYVGRRLVIDREELDRLVTPPAGCEPHASDEQGDDR
jgi:excisionase family DNA binding protein